MAPQAPLRVGFVSTRFAGTDGVSLETAKWASVLEGMGHRAFYFAGLCDRPPDVSHVVPEAHFQHPDIDGINSAVYSSRSVAAAVADTRGARPFVRAPAVSQLIHELREHLKGELHRFIASFGLDLLIVENASAIPLNLPLGLAISELVAETGIPTIAHHHDLPWERQRFLVNSVADVIAAAFPPTHASIRHVVINSLQAGELSSRRGVTARVIPNVMDFDRPPVPSAPERVAAVRADLGLLDGELLLLQPTRIVARKGIEDAIEFARRLEQPARLVISHAAGDEGGAYQRRVCEYAELLGVTLVLAGDRIDVDGTDGPADGTGGPRRHTLAEAYDAADFVTYPSRFEGFGNAFLEAVYHRKPILVNNYSTYEVDLRPRGFRVVWFDEFIDRHALDQARRLLDDPAEARRWADRNYEVGRTHFSFTVLERHLDDLLVDCFGAE